VGVALVLTTVLFLYFPVSWIEGLFPGSNFLDHDRKQAPDRWLVLSPPPAVMVEVEPAPEPREREKPVLPEDPRWWLEGWRIKTGSALIQDLAPSPADSAAALLVMLGLDEDFLQQARPDSVLASRLILMRVEDSMDLTEIKPYLEAMTRSRAYADILSRAADMYDDFLDFTIMTPD
jgi:hypothetical protein